MLQPHHNPVSEPGAAMDFSDARTCREWLKTIPLTNVLQAQQVMLDALRDMGRAELAAIERLTCLELGMQVELDGADLPVLQADGIGFAITWPEGHGPLTPAAET